VEESLVLFFLTTKGNRGGLRLERLEGKEKTGDIAVAKKWAEVLMDAAYDGSFIHISPDLELTTLSSLGVKRTKRLKVLVNPRGGVVRIEITI
jgi:hypothetical protein